MPIALCGVKDGVLSACPVLQLPIPPSANAAAWPTQLQFLETVDSHLRRVLGLALQPCQHRDYLCMWTDQVDTTLNADVPPALRGGSMKQFGSKELVGTRCYSPCTIDRLDPPTFPTAQVTSRKPTKITHILKTWAIRHSTRKLEPINAIMKLQKEGKPFPESLMAQCSTIVIDRSAVEIDFHALVFESDWNPAPRRPNVTGSVPGNLMRVCSFFRSPRGHQGTTPRRACMSTQRRHVRLT